MVPQGPHQFIPNLLDSQVISGIVHMSIWAEGQKAIDGFGMCHLICLSLFI